MSQRKLTKAQACDLLGVSAKQMERYVADGIPHTGTGAKRRFPWPEIRKWRDALLIEQGKAKAERRPAPPADFAEAQARKMSAEASLAELKLEEAEGTVIPVDMYERRLGEVCDRLRGAVMAIPSKFLGRIQAARTDAEAQGVGEAIRDDVLRGFMDAADEGEADAGDSGSVDAAA